MLTESSEARVGIDAKNLEPTKNTKQSCIRCVPSNPHQGRVHEFWLAGRFDGDTTP
jgi:hypothetical protein